MAVMTFFLCQRAKSLVVTPDGFLVRLSAGFASLVCLENVDEDSLSPQRPRAASVQGHAHGFRFREARFAHDQLRGAGLELAEVHLHQLGDHPPLAASDAAHVHAHRSGRDTQTPGRVDQRNSLDAVNDVLAGQASDVRAGAADHRAFDDDGLLALARQGPGNDLARDPLPMIRF
jgi:hypothetical protein